MNESSNSDSVIARALSRRSFMRRSSMLAALSPAVLMSLAHPERAESAVPFPPGNELDIAVLNFALTLEYLEGEYYTRGVTGAGLAAAGTDVAPSGAAGSVIVKSSSTQVTFTSPALEAYATEIAQDERNHIAYIQNVIADLGGTPVSEPNLNLLDSFNNIANNAGIAATFDPYADEVSFILGGFSLTDVGVTAYLGGGPLLTSKAALKGAAGILAIEAYHDASLRLSIFQAGSDAQAKAQAVSDLRDDLDDGGKKDKDQGVANQDGTPNIVPTDGNSLAFARSTRQVLNIVYGVRGAATGGFFPSGLNGDIKS